MEIKRLEATKPNSDNLDERRSIEHDDILLELEELRIQKGRDKEAQSIAEKEHSALLRKVETLQNKLKATESQLRDSKTAEEELKLMGGTHGRSQQLKKQLQVSVHQMPHPAVDCSDSHPKCVVYP